MARTKQAEQAEVGCLVVMVATMSAVMWVAKAATVAAAAAL